MIYQKASRVLTILLAGAFFVIPQYVFASFSDVPTNHMYYNAITALEEQNIIKGYKDGSFQPEKLITKAEFAKTVFNHAGYRPPEKMYETPFKDVPAGSWFAPYVKKAYNLGIINLNTEIPHFFPKQPVSRIEALRFIMPLEGIPAPLSSDDTIIIFEDIEPDSLYSHYVRAAQKTGIFIAEEQPHFFPLKNITRGEAAELLYRAQIYRQIIGDPISFPSEEMIGTVEIEKNSGPDLIDNPKFPILLSVWTKINNEYLYKEEVDPDELVYGAISGMVETLDDEHSLFQDPEDSGELYESLEGSYEGIGTVIDIFENEFLIIAVMQGSPAEEAGLKSGDTILEVDGKDVSNYTITDLIDSIKGPSGSEVTIKVRREGKILTYDVTRTKISLDTVLLEGSFEVPGNIGYIAVYQFTDSTSAEFERLLTETLTDETKGLIIDLRDNPGGYVDAAYEILDLFVPRGEALIKLKFNGNIRDENSNGPGSIAEEDMPIMILVNENTASAAEIVASSLQDHGIATLIGETTYGKGTMQEVNIYTDGSLFKLSIAEWFSPEQNKVDGEGLTPDIVVSKTKDDALGKTDSQLERAIQEIEKQL